MKALILLAVLLSTGCASNVALRESSDFGVSRLEMRRPDGTHVKLDLGKEYASFKASLSWDEEGRPAVKVEAVGVRAFEGQALAAHVVAEVERQISVRTAAGGVITSGVVGGIVQKVLAGALGLAP